MSQKLEYAFRALAQLARCYDGHTLTRLEELAQREAVSPNFLVQILADLRRAGIVESRRGHAGGYLLAQAPASTSFVQVIEAIDPSLLQSSLSDAGASGPQLGRLWKVISANLHAELAATTLEDLIAQPDEGMFYI